MRVRRGVLPSSLMGLVAFSLTLLVFSAVVYTSSLPGLVMARAHASDNGLFPVIAQALLGEDGGLGSDGQKDTAGNSASGAAASSSASSKSGASHRPGFSLGGAVLQGIGKPSGGSQGANPDKPGEGGGPDTPGSGDTDVPGGDGGGGEGGGPGTGGEGEGGQGQEPGEPGPSPEEEQKTYEFLLGKAQAVDGYVAEVNACVTSFNQDCLAAISVRRDHKAACDALSARLFNEFATVLNTPVANESAYKKAQGDLIGMFRCLLEYLGTIQEAWELNVGFEDPAAHVDEFMFPVNRDTVNGQNVHLTEFYTYYNGFVL